MEASGTGNQIHTHDPLTNEQSPWGMFLWLISWILQRLWISLCICHHVWRCLSDGPRSNISDEKKLASVIWQNLFQKDWKTDFSECILFSCLLYEYQIRFLPAVQTWSVSLRQHSFEPVNVTLPSAALYCVVHTSLCPERLHPSLLLDNENNFIVVVKIFYLMNIWTLC